ncbi:OLC1v1015732C1 [Oldenlandia corymbosa var. corymbosa]|uniref:OLC1v1015732C1 n=1 Tax=Oldenlandia corymbosa var. corymbosa TaxID=529605 RepID=A0AAV1E3Y7_OLDCO|nr:OLC1v1015732C1 [Oldenlandia corymbosa var. corymbosa]
MEVLMYKLVQQPPLMLYPDIMFSSIMIIPGDYNNVLRAQKYDGLRVEENGNIIIFDAIPISRKAHGGRALKSIYSSKKENAKVEAQVAMKTAIALAQQLSKLERQRNWWIQQKMGLKGRIHKYYHHIQTNVVFRSLIEIFHFVEHGKLPKHYYKANHMPQETVSIEGSSRKAVKGFKLIKEKKVGYYNSLTKTIFRLPTPLEETIDSQKTDSLKRKRHDESIHEPGEVMQHEDPHKCPLYDFEPL